jgi:hypothetical protein
MVSRRIRRRLQLIFEVSLYTAVVPLAIVLGALYLSLRYFVKRVFVSGPCQAREHYADYLRQWRDA